MSQTEWGMNLWAACLVLTRAQFKESMLGQCVFFFFLQWQAKLWLDLFLKIFPPGQNTDAALLPTISYPAFAVDDDALYSQTLDKIVRKLRGKYGFKRFLRDGYRTANEDKNRRYYKPAEMKVSFLTIDMCFNNPG